MITVEHKALTSKKCVSILFKYITLKSNVFKITGHTYRGTHFDLPPTFLKSSLYTALFCHFTFVITLFSPLTDVFIMPLVRWFVGITTGCNTKCVVCFYRWLFGVTFAICPSRRRNNAVLHRVRESFVFGWPLSGKQTRRALLLF